MTVAAEQGATTTTPEGQQQQAPASENQQVTTPATTEQPTTPPAAAPEVIGEATPGTGPEGEQQGEAFQYHETGDPGLDIALTFIGSMGLGPDDPAVKAATDGKFELLEAKLAALGDKAKGFERYVALAKDAHQRTTEATARTQMEITAAVHAAAGDADTWGKVKEWAGKNADPAEKEAINAMLSAGPVQARAAALMLSQLYRDAGGTVVNPADPKNENAGNGTPTTNGALSPAQYGEAVRELRGRLGSRFDSSPEYTALKARRAAWRG